MASPTSLGRVQPLYKGAYNANTPYEKLDNVFYNNETWVCVASNTIQGVTPSAIPSGMWQLVAAKGGTGDTGPQGPGAGFGVPTATASILPPGSDPTVVITTASGSPDTAKVFAFDFGIPAGPLGFDSVGASTSNLAAGTAATASASLIYAANSTTLFFNFGIPAADGQGATQVDDVTANASRIVELHALKYVSQTLSDPQKSQARSNINAQIAGNYITNPTEKTYGQYLCYGGSDSNPTWIAKTIQELPTTDIAGYILRTQTNGTIAWTPGREVPSGGSTSAVLMKNSGVDYDYSWSPAMSSSEIDAIINE